MGTLHVKVDMLASVFGSSIMFFYGRIVRFQQHGDLLGCGHWKGDMLFCQ